MFFLTLVSLQSCLVYSTWLGLILQCAVTWPNCPPLSPVTGCTDSSPLRTTSDCHYAAESKISLHGLNFNHFCSNEPHSVHSNSNSAQQNPPRMNTGMCSANFKKHYSISVGPFNCKNVQILSEFVINCTLERGTGRDLGVVIKREIAGQQKSQSSDDSIVAILEGAVSYREAINFREKFSKFVELGVGGLKREIDELYRRAFASRG